MKKRGADRRWTSLDSDEICNGLFTLVMMVLTGDIWWPVPELNSNKILFSFFFHKMLLERRGLDCVDDKILRHLTDALAQSSLYVVRKY